MPFGRYLIFVGSALMALLFLVDSYLPRTTGSFGREVKVDTSIIRIVSARKWPERIIFDTRQPIVAVAPVLAGEAPLPSVTTAVAASEPPEKTREAFARLTARPDQEHASKTRPRRKIVRRPLDSHLAAYPGSPQNWFAGW